MSPDEPDNVSAESAAEAPRRSFMTGVLMFGGLALSHLAAFGFAARYLYPVSRRSMRRVYVAALSSMPPGTARAFRTPQGQTINIVHTHDGFTALSDVCPHLGCRVHWDRVASEFICPCHNGHFDATGAPLAGPPKDMNTPLQKFDVIVEGGNLFLELPVTT